MKTRNTVISETILGGFLRDKAEKLKPEVDVDSRVGRINKYDSFLQGKVHLLAKVLNLEANNNCEWE